MALDGAMVLGELLARTPAEHWTGVGAVFERLRRPRVNHVQSATDEMSQLAALPGWLRDLTAPILGPKNYRAAYAPLRTAAIEPGA
jgi:2-polyprenyl-6-methoxyphenol hydroxylase-like FAD-dependent oxidoreductase